MLMGLFNTSSDRKKTDGRVIGQITAYAIRMYDRNNNDPKTVPWDTLDRASELDDDDPFILLSGVFFKEIN